MSFRHRTAVSAAAGVNLITMICLRPFCGFYPQRPVTTSFNRFAHEVFSAPHIHAASPRRGGEYTMCMPFHQTAGDRLLQLPLLPPSTRCNLFAFAFMDGAVNLPSFVAELFEAFGP